MASVLQVKRRINGAAGSPGAPGAKEGELALNFPGAAGATTKPELWAFDGAAWRRANPDTNVTVGVATLPGGTAGSATGIGGAWTAFGTKPTDPIIIATFAGTAFVKTGAGGADADWTALGAATAFATAAEVLAGTDAAKAINSVGLQSRLTAVPDATPANDARKVVQLNATGKIDAGFLPATASALRGAVDVTAAMALTPAAKTGEYWFANKAGTVHASWTGAGGQTVASGDMVVFDGTNFHLVPNDVDLAAYVPLAGTAGMTGNIVWAGAANNKAGTNIVDGKGGTLDNVVVDAGTF